MKKEKFEEILKNLELEKFKWHTLTEFESIILDNGRGIYPNWLFQRFLITNNEILIKHGYSELYGCRLGRRFMISYDNKSLSFPPESVITTLDDCKPFRLPKKGDIIRSTQGQKVLSESLISEVSTGNNLFLIEVVNPIKYTNDSLLSFYDPMTTFTDTSIHGTEREGIYALFNENNGKNKRYGVQHEIIKIKNIKEVNLRLLKCNKTYKIT